MYFHWPFDGKNIWWVSGNIFVPYLMNAALIYEQKVWKQKKGEHGWLFNDIPANIKNIKEPLKLI